MLFYNFKIPQISNFEAKIRSLTRERDREQSTRLVKMRKRIHDRKIREKYVKDERTKENGEK